MARPKIDIDRAANILVMAEFYGDKEAAKSHGISLRTISNYREKSQNNKELAEAFLLKKRDLTKDIKNPLKEAIENTIDYLNRSAKSADPTDPKAIYSIAGALKILAEIDLTQKVLDARNAEQS